MWCHSSIECCAGLVTSHVTIYAVAMHMWQAVLPPLGVCITTDRVAKAGNNTSALCAWLRKCLSLTGKQIVYQYFTSVNSIFVVMSYQHVSLPTWAVQVHTSQDLEVTQQLKTCILTTLSSPTIFQAARPVALICSWVGYICRADGRGSRRGGGGRWGWGRLGRWGGIGG